MEMTFIFSVLLFGPWNVSIASVTMAKHGRQFLIDGQATFAKIRMNLKEYSQLPNDLYSINYNTED